MADTLHSIRTALDMPIWLQALLLIFVALSPWVIKRMRGTKF
jgi:hypothetical protein